MKNTPTDNAKTGILVLSGLLFLILMLYMMGRNRNLFGSTFTLRAIVTDVNGLVPGNNVRFRGMDIGTVKSLSLENDTTIFVSMLIDESMQPFIRKNALISISTDGLMGSKLVNILHRNGESEAISEADILQSVQPVDTDEMLRTLQTTNQNMEKITHNLYDISLKLTGSISLWTLLSDTTMTRDLQSAVANLRIAGNNTAEMTQAAKEFTLRLESGKGLASQLFTDSSMVSHVSASLLEMEQASRNTALIIEDLQTLVLDLKQGEGTAGLLLSDTLLRNTLLQSALHVEQGTKGFHQNMEALKRNILFRGYFRKLEKQKKEKARHEEVRARK